MLLSYFNSKSCFRGTKKKQNKKTKENKTKTNKKKIKYDLKKSQAVHIIIHCN